MALSTANIGRHTAPADFDTIISSNTTCGISTKDISIYRTAAHCDCIAFVYATCVTISSMPTIDAAYRAGLDVDLILHNVTRVGMTAINYVASFECTAIDGDTIFRNQAIAGPGTMNINSAGNGTTSDCDRIFRHVYCVTVIIRGTTIYVLFNGTALYFNFIFICLTYRSTGASRKIAAPDNIINCSCAGYTHLVIRDLIAAYAQTTNDLLNRTATDIDSGILNISGS